VEKSRQFPFAGCLFIGAFSFQGPGLHDGAYLAHVEAQALVGYPFVEQGMGLFYWQELAFIGGVAESAASEGEDGG
jgi:hypothetical protein